MQNSPGQLRNSTILLLVAQTLCFLIVSVQFVVLTPAAYAQDSKWQSDIDAGKEARHQKNYKEAEKLFALALRDAESFEAGDKRLVKSLDELAYTFELDHRDADAEPLYIRTLAIREKALGQDHPDVAASLQMLSRTEVNCGKFERADALFTRALAILKQRGDIDGAAISLNNMGTTYLNKDEYARADELLGEAIRLKPNYGLAYYNRCIARTKLGDAAGASQDHEQWSRLEPLKYVGH
jgi:tetratricopeptide (TPR) repeat protein